MSRIAFLYGFLLFLQAPLFAQHQVVGTVFDFTTKEPLEGVSVFYDGTSIGTITDEKGTFTLVSENPISASLVLSYIGYTSQLFENVSGGLGAIYLEESVVQLNEIVLKPDTWSREKKLNIFRREFLGTTIAGLQCKIKNEDDIRLYYNKEKNTLYAFAEVPIQIENRYLGYLIRYNLQDFEVNFGSNFNTSFFGATYVYMAGTIFFSEINGKKTKKRYLKNRLKIYLGSPLHFMRALVKKQLQEEKYQIFKDKFQVDPYSEYEIEVLEKQTKLTQQANKLTVLFDGMEQSFIEVKAPIFYIDAYGNHSPTNTIFFGGVFGKQRVGDLVPLDYVVEAQ